MRDRAIVDNEGEVAATAGAPPSWLAPSQARPQAFVLSNGHLSSLVTGAGGGGLRWRGLALTRYEPDATRDADGIWFYLRDEVTRHVWVARRATMTLDGVRLDDSRIGLDPNTPGTHEVYVRLGPTCVALHVERGVTDSDEGVAAEPVIP